MATVKSTSKEPARGAKNLLIIESPNKIKSIKKILGSKYEVLSSKDISAICPLPVWA